MAELPALPWSGKLYLHRGGSVLDVEATYADTDNSGTMNPTDVGWIAPGSTIKVLVALAAIEQRGDRSSLEQDLELALVVSDNQAANRLIDAAGGIDRLNAILRERGFPHTIIGRKFGSSEGTLSICQEINRPGNCSDAVDLLRSLMAITEGGVFNITDSDRDWLMAIMSMTPREAGYDLPDNHCRLFLYPGIQKCGVSPFSPQQYSNIAYLPDSDTYAFASVTPPPGTSDDEIAIQLTSILDWGLARL